MLRMPESQGLIHSTKLKEKEKERKGREERRKRGATQTSEKVSLYIGRFKIDWKLK